LFLFEGGSMEPGFAALSALVGALGLGRLAPLRPIALSGADIFKFAALWGAAFLLVGFVEEGIFRCYLQFTLTRGINFWWALGSSAPDLPGAAAPLQGQRRLGRLRRCPAGA
jgi:membrane protease YdiL (CAAX protease family)